MLPILFGTSVLLVAVALVNLLATLLLVTRERARDFAIFKAVGLTPRGVLGVVNSGGAVLGAIAIAIGIPAGIVTFRGVMQVLSPSEGTDIVGVPGPFALALTIPVVLAVTALASSLPARRAARASAAAVLRAEVSSALGQLRQEQPEQDARRTADDARDPAGVRGRERQQDQHGGDRHHAQQVAVVLAALAAAEHVAHRPRGEQAERGAVGPARDPLVQQDTATYAPPAPQIRNTNSVAHQPWRRSSSQPNSAIAPTHTAS